MANEQKTKTSFIIPGSPISKLYKEIDLRLLEQGYGIPVMEIGLSFLRGYPIPDTYQEIAKEFLENNPDIRMDEKRFLYHLSIISTTYVTRDFGIRAESMVKAHDGNKNRF